MEGCKISNITDMVKISKFAEKVEKFTILELFHSIDDLSDFNIVIIF